MVEVATLRLETALKKTRNILEVVYFTYDVLPNYSNHPAFFEMSSNFKQSKLKLLQMSLKYLHYF